MTAFERSWPKTIAILVASGSEAAKVSASLNAGAKPVLHKLMFDEDEALWGRLHGTPERCSRGRLMDEYGERFASRV
jgi:hypothetical protein